MLLFACSSPSLIALCWWFCPQKPTSAKNAKPRGRILRGSILPQPPRWPVPLQDPVSQAPGGCQGERVGVPRWRGHRSPPGAGHLRLPVPTPRCPRPRRQPRREGGVRGRQNPALPRHFEVFRRAKKTHAESNRWGGGKEEAGRERGALNGAEGIGKGIGVFRCRDLHTGGWMDGCPPPPLQKGGVGVPRARRSPLARLHAPLWVLGRAPRRWYSPPSIRLSKTGGTVTLFSCI